MIDELLQELDHTLKTRADLIQELLTNNAGSDKIMAQLLELESELSFFELPHFTELISTLLKHVQQKQWDKLKQQLPELRTLLIKKAELSEGEEPDVPHQPLDTSASSHAVQGTPLSEDALELLDDFLDESEELLDLFFDVIFSLNLTTPQRELLDSAFRAIHTIKGGAGFLELEKLGLICHDVEHLLDQWRTGETLPNKDQLQRLISFSEQLSSYLTELRQHRAIPATSFDPITLKLEPKEESAEISQPTLAIFRPRPEQIPKENLELLGPFLDEAQDFLESYRSALERLHVDPTEEKTLDEAFRGVHTIKGNAGFLHLTQLEAISEAGEQILAKLKTGGELTKELFSALLTIADGIDRSLQQLHNTLKSTPLQEKSSLPIPVKPPSSTIRIGLEKINQMMKTGTALLLLKNKIQLTSDEADN